jgi:hypothetical protein
MATTLIFDSEEALRAALTSGLIPEQMHTATARYVRQPDGALHISPRRGPGKKKLEALQQAGVVLGQDLPKDAATASCWAEIVRASWQGEQDVGSSLVLFALARSEDLLPLAGELLRLGCDRQELCFYKGKPAGKRKSAENGANNDGVPAAFLRAVDPPYYTVAKAIDESQGLRAFTPLIAGQEQSWIEAGYEHPFSELLRPQDEQMLLVYGDGRFANLARGEFFDLYQLVDVALPDADKLGAQPDPDRLKVSLELCPRARQATPSFWVVQKDSLRFIESLVRQLPEAEIARLLFAVAYDESGDGKQAEERNPIVLIKARVGRTPPVLEVPGLSYAAWLGIDNLFLPAEAMLDPPLRPETLRRQLAADPSELTWLQPLGANENNDDSAHARGFRVMRIDEAAFAPLSDWVDYVVHHDADQLKSWSDAVSFELEQFESIGVEWSDRPAPPKPPEKKKERPARRERVEVLEQEPEEELDATPVKLEKKKVAAEPKVAVAIVEPGAEEKALSELGHAFFEVKGAADADERLEILQQMAVLYGRQGRVRQAALCWTRVIWPADSDAAAPCIVAWDTSLTASESLQKHLDNQSPEAPEVYAVAAALIAARAHQTALDGELVRKAQVWLDTNQGVLDVRSLWLSRLALAQLVGGDQLGLVRARDEVIGRLSHGLSLGRDVPAFVRLQGDDDGKPTAEVLAAQLEALFARYKKAKRDRTPVEAPEKLTGGYVRLLFAYGFARLGRADRARQLSDEAANSIEIGDDAIHRYLVDAYQGRIAQALEGLPREAPLAAEISAQLNDLERFARYKVDRLRQASEVLEPHERLDPTRGFTEAQSDPRGEEFAPMRALVDRVELSKAVDEVMQKALAAETSVDERVRLFDGVMDFFPRLTEDIALPHLRTLVSRVDDVEAPRRCDLLCEALMLAGLFGRGDLVADLAGSIETLTAELGAEHVTEIGEALGEVLRALRRVGQRDRAAALLKSGSQAITGDSAEALVARLSLAAGLADLGHFEQAQPAVDQGRKALARADLRMVDRLRITRAMATAFSYMPRADALAGLGELATQLPRISDSFNTNSHFCLSVIQFIESLVVGYASEQLSLGEAGRAYLDDDESLLRRKIDADLRAAG